MTEENKNTLRQAEALVNVEGILSEKKLEKAVDSEGKEIIRGSLKIKENDTNFITLNVYVNRYTKDGKENNAYAGMVTVMDEYQSIAEVGEEAATRVRCGKGALKPNTYVDKRTGDVKTNVRYDATYVSRVDDLTKYEPKAKFEVEGYIVSMIPEVKKDEETGRLIVNILVPTYNGIEPMVITVGDDLASEFEGMFEPGQTARFFGILKNNVIVEEKVIKMALGKSEIKKSYDYVDERFLTGAQDPYEEEQAYSAEAIKKAMADREMKLENDKKKVAEAKQNANKAAVTANVSNTGRPIPKFSM